MKFLELLLKGIFCHLVGDYVLQIDFIAKTKGENWYHMFVHCALYCLPFYVLYGMDWRLPILFISHIVIDTAKAKCHSISPVTDQVLHYLVIAMMYWY